MLKETRADLINISHREVDSHVFFGHDGSLLCGWTLTGLDCEALSSTAINHRLYEVGRALLGCEDYDTLWLTLERAFVEEPSANGVHLFRDTGNMGLRLQANSQRMSFENRLALVFQSDVKMAQDAERPRLFEARAKQIEAAFSRHFKLIPFGPSAGTGTSEFFDLLNRMVHVDVTKRRNGALCPLRNLSINLAPHFVQTSPNALPEIFAEDVAIFSLEGFTGETVNTRALRDLETLDAEYRWTTRLTMIHQKELGKKVKARQAEWRQASGDLAQTIATGEKSIKDVGSAIADAELEALEFSSGRSGEQYCSLSSVFLFKGNISDLDLGDQDAGDGMAIDFFTQLDAVAAAAHVSLIIEREHALTTYLESIPGTRGRDRRDKVVEAGLGLCLAPIQSIWKGSPVNPSKLFPEASPSLMRGYSIGGEEFHFNLHADDRGHTLIIVPTGGGKSVLLSAIAASFMQYENAQVIFFDKLKSSFSTALALGGVVYDFSAESTRGMAPLGAIKDLGEPWGQKWLEMILEQAGVPRNPASSAEIADFVYSIRNGGGTFDSIKNTTLSKSIMPALLRYLNDPHLDARDTNNHKSPAADFDWNPFTVFETDELFSANEQKAILLLDYIFERVNKQLDGRPTLIIIDEAKAFLRHPVFAERIEMWIQESGKKNVALVMASQSWSHFANAPCGTALRENTFTRIFMQNTDAIEDAIANDLRGAGLSDHQIQIITEMVPKRHYLVTQKDRAGGGGDRLLARVVDFGFEQEFQKLITETDKVDSDRALNQQPNDPEFWLRNLLEKSRHA